MKRDVSGARGPARPRPLAIATLVLITLAGLCPPDVAAADAALAEEALERLHLSADQRRRLLRGEVLGYPVAEHGARELAVGLALFVAAPFGHVGGYLASGDLLARDASVAAQGPLPDAPTPGSPPAARFAASERDEAESLLDAAPGTRFNLSAGEIAGLRALRAATGRSGATTVEQVTAEYWKLLRERGHAYRQAGLTGMAPYARGGGALTDPAAELRAAVSDAEQVARYGPELQAALARYPEAPPRDVVNRVYWIKRRVQRRPQLSLLHQMVLARPDVVAHVERYFYVGHSYNAAQIITGAFAHGDGTVIFATSRFSTDEVLGLGNQLKRAVGRTQLRDEMRKRLEAVALALGRPVVPSPQTP